MKRGLFFILLCVLVSVLGVIPAYADTPMTHEEIWNACWSRDHADTNRSIRYPEPINLVIHNRSRKDWYICVYDNLCPYTLFNGRLSFNYSITLGACADQWGYGSVTLMNAEGSMWFYEHTRDRLITIK